MMGLILQRGTLGLSRSFGPVQFLPVAVGIGGETVKYFLIQIRPGFVETQAFFKIFLGYMVNFKNRFQQILVGLHLIFFRGCLW